MSKETQPKKEKNKIGSAEAKAQIKILTDFYDIDFEYIPQVSRGSFEETLLNLEKACRRGRLEIKVTEDCECAVILHCAKEAITFDVLSGEAKVAMSKAAPGDQHDRVFHLLGYMCGLGPDAIKELKGKELSTAESLGLFFLQA